jgi:hypothetical protein
LGDECDLSTLYTCMKISWNPLFYTFNRW